MGVLGWFDLVTKVSQPKHALPALRGLFAEPAVQAVLVCGWWSLWG